MNQGKVVSLFVYSQANLFSVISRNWISNILNFIQLPDQ
jgi:hypothetical protein